jgi:hypothetical protein
VASSTCVGVMPKVSRCSTSVEAHKLVRRILRRGRAATMEWKRLAGGRPLR